MSTLVVIAKAPRAGRVKTRLCPPCTPAQAASLAHAALDDTLAAVLATPCDRRLLALDGEPGPWLPDGIEVVAQRGDGLAERLACAFEEAGGPALLVGMDTPQLEPGGLRAGIGLLARPGIDAVLGPAPDGGYWAIGLRRPDREVFRGVPMSATRTGAAQRARLERLGLRVAGLPRLRDVDTIGDALTVAREAPSTRFAARLAAIAPERAA